MLMAACSVCFFVGRGWYVQRSGAGLPRSLWARYVPDAIDTVLMITGVMLMLESEQYPTTHDWLAWKLSLLLVYIGLGSVALRYGKTPRIRLLAWLSALLVLLAMLWLATHH